MSYYSIFYEHSLPHNINDLEHIAEHFDVSVTDVDIWEIARCSEDPPHLGNAYLSILFSRLESKINEQYPELKTDYFINGMDSHFYIDEQRLYSFDYFMELVASHQDQLE